MWANLPSLSLPFFLSLQFSGMGGPPVCFWLHLAFKMRTLCRSYREDMALIRGILNTLFKPREIRGMFSVMLWHQMRSRRWGPGVREAGPCLAAAASWIPSD